MSLGKREARDEADLASDLTISPVRSERDERKRNTTLSILGALMINSPYFLGTLSTIISHFFFDKHKWGQALGSGFIVKNVKEIKPTPRPSKMIKPDPAG